MTRPIQRSAGLIHPLSGRDPLPAGGAWPFVNG
jgi:hypothetical protein